MYWRNLEGKVPSKQLIDKVIIKADDSQGHHIGL